MVTVKISVLALKINCRALYIIFSRLRRLRIFYVYILHVWAFIQKTIALDFTPKTLAMMCFHLNMGITDTYYRQGRTVKFAL